MKIKSNEKNKINIVPFLKWAGGKRWLINRYSYLLPTNFNRYIEPFLGGGAVFFYLNPKQAILSDVNEELINTYQAIKNNWRKVQKYLIVHNKNHNNSYFYEIRDSSPNSLYKRAARFIYLNRTCWNGLYRVNLEGTFNVPRGTKNKVLLEDDNFEMIALRLKCTRIIVSDFEKIINIASKNDLLFIDPPYTIKHKSNGFIKYNEQLFHWNDQLRLRDCLIDAKNRGVKIFMTNACHSSIRNLYEKYFEILSIKRSSIIAANPLYRKASEEYIVRSI
jgi:DNA adenine methylase